MKIFIIASKYNYKHVPTIQEKLEKMGHVITLPNCYDDPFLEERVKKESHEEHAKLKCRLIKEQFEKVKNNDAVLVLNYEKNGVKNYIGGATFLEMSKAFDLGKKIFMMNPIPKGILYDEITGMCPEILHGDLGKINEIVYNKLIRDKIPEITKADGWTSVARKLNQKEYTMELRKKIFEEAKELNEGSGKDNLVEELVDLQEIIDAILAAKGVTSSEFKKIQTAKRIKRGGFEKRLFLVKTIKENK